MFHFIFRKRSPSQAEIPEIVEIGMIDPDDQPIAHCIPMVDSLGLYAPEVDYGVDVDLLPLEAWEVCYFTPPAQQGAVYVCETLIDNQPHTVWWHLGLWRYLAQAIPADLLSEPDYKDY